MVIVAPILIGGVLYDLRNKLCKSKYTIYYYVTVPLVLGIILISSSVIIGYKTNFVGAKGELKIISDLIFLKGPVQPYGNYNAVLYWAMAGYLFILFSIETFIICKLLEKGIISPKKGNDV